MSDEVICVYLVDCCVGDLMLGKLWEEVIVVDGLWLGFVSIELGIVLGWYYYGGYDMFSYVIEGVVWIEFGLGGL